MFTPIRRAGSHATEALEVSTIGSISL